MTHPSFVHFLDHSSCLLCHDSPRQYGGWREESQGEKVAPSLLEVPSCASQASMFYTCLFPLLKKIIKGTET